MIAQSMPTATTMMAPTLAPVTAVLSEMERYVKMSTNVSRHLVARMAHVPTQKAASNATATQATMATASSVVTLTNVKREKIIATSTATATTYPAVSNAFAT